MTKQALWSTFKYLLALSLLTYVVWANWAPAGGSGLKDVWQSHVVEQKPVHTGFLALAVLCLTASILITFVRWYILVRAVGLPFTLPDALRLGMVGYFFNTFLPGSVGGDIIKAAFIAREQNRRTVAVATVLIDRALALWGLVWFVALLGSAFWAAGFFQGEVAQTLRSIVVSALGIIAVTSAVWLLLGVLPPHRADRFAGRLERLPKVGHSAAEFWRAVWMYRCQQGSVAAALALALVGFVGFVLTFYFSVLTLWDGGQKIPGLVEHFLLVPIGLVIQAIPLFPGGAGVGELGFGGLYRLVGCAAAIGVLGSLVQRVISWGLGLLGYVVYLRMRPALQPQPETTAVLTAAEA